MFTNERGEALCRGVSPTKEQRPHAPQTRAQAGCCRSSAPRTADEDADANRTPPTRNAPPSLTAPSANVRKYTHRPDITPARFERAARGGSTTASSAARPIPVRCCCPLRCPLLPSPAQRPGPPACCHRCWRAGGRCKRRGHAAGGIRSRRREGCSGFVAGSLGVAHWEAAAGR